MAATIVLVAGASGSGKSRMALMAGVPQLKLDEFYHDGDHPGLPRTLGIVDWDDVSTWNLPAAVGALEELVHAGRADIPVYEIAANARVGTEQMRLGDHNVLVAEGIFAPDLLRPARAAGLHVVPMWLDRPRTVTALRRLRRDLAQRRKAPPVLVRRGFALWRAEPAMRRRALELGFAPTSFSEALEQVDQLRDGT